MKGVAAFTSLSQMLAEEQQLGENEGSCSFSPIAIIAGWQRLQQSISSGPIIIGLFDKNSAWRALVKRVAGFAGKGEKGTRVQSSHLLLREIKSL